VNAATPHPPHGRHLLLDLSGAEAGVLRDAAGIERLLSEAAELAGATPLGTRFHHFGAGAGVTGVVLLQESHISIHTWPEHGFAAVDIFMCGDTRPEDAARYLIARLNPRRHDLRTVIRALEPVQAHSADVVDA
jgi:S-adenosylmethionine decarboxylase